MKVFDCCYQCSTTFADEQFFFLVLDNGFSVEGCHIINGIREPDTLSGYTVLLALAAEDALAVVSSYGTYLFLLIVNECYSQWRTDICTSFASDAVCIVNNRLPSEVLEGNMFYSGEFRCVCRSDQ